MEFPWWNVLKSYELAMVVSEAGTSRHQQEI